MTTSGAPAPASRDGAHVVVVGLGPAGPEHLTQATIDAIDRVRHRYLRTERHPSASAVPSARSFDELYESGETFDEVYRAIVDELVRGAREHGEVLYAVPGSPSVAERTVELLRADPRVSAEVLPSLSFCDLAWHRLGVDPLVVGAQLIDAQRFRAEAAGSHGPFLVAQCHSSSVLSTMKLALDVESVDAPRVTVLQRLGLPDESVFEIDWNDLDRAVVPDHLTSVYVPRMAAPAAGELVRLEELMRRLREECPWDAQQTHASLSRYLVEECYELVEAIAALPPEHSSAGSGPDRSVVYEVGGDHIDHLREELGDVLFQVVFHACLAAEQGWFELSDIAASLSDKLVHRHPHVFPRDDFVVAEGASSLDIARNWQLIKAAERGEQRASGSSGSGGSAGSPVATDPLPSLPAHLPALLYSLELIKAAEKAGVGAPASDGNDASDLLWNAVLEARRAGVDPEVVLRVKAASMREAIASALARSAG